MNKWKLVPVEPTTSMLSGMLGAGCCKSLEKAYTAMLKAGPQPPKLSDERIREIWVEHGLDDEDVEGFARAIEREILGENNDSN